MCVSIEHTVRTLSSSKAESLLAIDLILFCQQKIQGLNGRISVITRRTKRRAARTMGSAWMENAAMADVSAIPAVKGFLQLTRNAWK